MSGRKASLRPVQRGIGGITVWRLPGSGLEIMWAGPGAVLFIGQATTPGGAVTRIEHRSADGSYDHYRDAQAAVDAFVAAGEEKPG